MLKPAVVAAVERLQAVVAGTTEEQARAASGLPGWSRGHVLTHLANFGEAMTRQVDEALAGRLVEMYDGGRAARDAGIEAGAHRPAAELVEHVTRATDGLLDAWRRVDDWTRPVSYRDSDLAATVQAGRREVEVHLVDLDLGATTDDWSAEFCLELLDFLRPRTPDGVRLVLDAGETRWEHGDGQVRVVKGELTDLTAWMAGRQPRGAVLGELPELRPWP